MEALLLGKLTVKDLSFFTPLTYLISSLLHPELLDTPYTEATNMLALGSKDKQIQPSI